jgi:hypothetical protein
MHDTNERHPPATVTRLRFDTDRLREAGESLGPVTSSVVPPTSTFEELIERADALKAHVSELLRRSA